MRIRSFIIAYALVLAILLFADRRPNPASQGRYSHVIDLTNAPTDETQKTTAQNRAGRGAAPAAEFVSRIIAPDALIPGTWTAGQIPAERLIAPLVVMDLKVADDSVAAGSQISLDDIAAWETKHGAVPQGAIVAIRKNVAGHTLSPAVLPITTDAAQFLMDARYTTGFVFETPAEFSSDRKLARQIALHGNYVIEGSARLTPLPATGSLIIVAPAKNKVSGKVPVRVLAMVR
jgi:kynurenine formamidase